MFFSPILPQPPAWGVSTRWLSWIGATSSRLGLAPSLGSRAPLRTRKTVAGPPLVCPHTTLVALSPTDPGVAGKRFPLLQNPAADGSLPRFGWGKKEATVTQATKRAI